MNGRLFYENKREQIRNFGSEFADEHGKHLYRVSNEMSLKSAFSTEGPVTMIAFELLLLRIEREFANDLFSRLESIDAFERL